MEEQFVQKKNSLSLIIIVVVLLLTLIAGGIFWLLRESNGTIIKGDYIGSYYKGNYVWGAAMNLAWNEMKENIIKEDVNLQTQDKKILEMISNFNKGSFDRTDMDEDSYYIKSGFSQKTVDIINKESKQKFPSKSFDDLDLELKQFDFISYAYFLKEVEYLSQFKKKDVQFKKNTVKGFYADGSAQKDNIKILRYWSDDKFIISLSLKQENDELILAKGFDMESPEKIVEEINGYKSYVKLGGLDSFEMPELHLDYYRDYEELLYKNFVNIGWEQYEIAEMFENIKFDMDNKGARVENEGVIVAEWGASPGVKINPRNFILDKSFWLIMKQKDSNNPYFILGVNNVDIME